MQKILSNNELLHVIFRKNSFKEPRTDLVAEDQFLQVAALVLPKDKTFKPHQHIKCDKKVEITQEAWIIIQGKVKVFYYDLEGKLLTEEILNSGDISITLKGGHNYLILEDNTLVYELKNGPYLGQAKDKVFINDSSI